MPVLDYYRNDNFSGYLLHMPWSTLTMRHSHPIRHLLGKVLSDTTSTYRRRQHNSCRHMPVLDYYRNDNFSGYLLHMPWSTLTMRHSHPIRHLLGKVLSDTTSTYRRRQHNSCRHVPVLDYYSRDNFSGYQLHRLWS